MYIQTCLDSQTLSTELKITCTNFPEHLNQDVSCYLITGEITLEVDVSHLISRARKW